MNAARENRGGNIDKLVDLGADIQAADTRGETALHWAARYGNRSAVKSLLDLTGNWDREKKACFLNKRGSRNRTALEMARRNARDKSDSNTLKAYQGVVRRLQREEEFVDVVVDQQSGLLEAALGMRRHEVAVGEVPLLEDDVVPPQPRECRHLGGERRVRAGPADEENPINIAGVLCLHEPPRRPRAIVGTDGEAYFIEVRNLGAEFGHFSDASTKVPVTMQLLGPPFRR